MDENFSDYPESFNKDLFTKIFKAVSRGESVTLIAPPGMGKTLTLQLLTKKLPNSLYLDLNGQWEKNISTDKPLTILLDHAEDISDQLYFKSVREIARDKITFVFAINRSTVPMGPLESVLLENIIYLEPLSPTDTKVFLEKMEKLYRGKLTASQKQKILNTSGSIPRIIKRLVKLSIDNIDPANDPKLQNDLEEINKFLINNPQVKWTLPLLSKTPTNQEKIGEVEFQETLSKQEYLLAKLLIENKDKMITRQDMIEAVWKNNQYEVNDHALDQMLHRLRKKLESATPKCELIVYRGRGVKLVY